MAVFTETLMTAIHTNYLAIILLIMYGPILIVNIFHMNCDNEVSETLTLESKIFVSYDVWRLEVLKGMRYSLEMFGLAV
jgi:hypothetical protein